MSWLTTQYKGKRKGIGEVHLGGHLFIVCVITGKSENGARAVFLAEMGHC